MRIPSMMAAAALVLGLAATAQAKNMDGKWGFGGSLQSQSRVTPAGGNNSPNATIDGIYWLGDLALEGRFGFNVNAIDGGATGVGFTGGVGIIYNFAKFETVNVGTGLRIDGRLYSLDNRDTEITLGFGVPLRGEYFFSENFAVNGSVGIGFDFAAEANNNASVIGFGTPSAGFFGGFGFTFYMN